MNIMTLVRNRKTKLFQLICTKAHLRRRFVHLALENEKKKKKKKE